jgi:hypothetical protein
LERQGKFLNSLGVITGVRKPGTLIKKSLDFSGSFLPLFGLFDFRFLLFQLFRR